jgi:hypothetical protein
VAPPSRTATESGTASGVLLTVDDDTPFHPREVVHECGPPLYQLPFYGGSCLVSVRQPLWTPTVPSALLQLSKQAFDTGPPLCHSISPKRLEQLRIPGDSTPSGCQVANSVQWAVGIPGSPPGVVRSSVQ